MLQNRTQAFLKRFELEEFPQPEIIRLRYPVLLCHGYGAVASLIKTSPMDEVCMHLRKHAIPAIAPNIVPYAKIETRGKQWVKKINEICDKHRFEKLNVVAHSMGGLDMRYALHNSNIHKKVASLTTVSTPHHGSSLADWILDYPDNIRERLGQIFNWFGESIYPSTKSDAMGAVRQLTRDYIQNRFNPKYPPHPDLPVFSYASQVGKGTDQPLNRIYRFQNNLIYDEEGPNDCFVSVESAKWAEFIETAPLSHMEHVKIAISKDRIPLFENFWIDIARRLQSEGF